ncbi:UbiA family prenyltransferase [Actinophytocola sp.]|uniref:UbiA family prenyltransferase n=1 Tax=Actinophytocola sp. TaxID=1872138 RepID=UPI002ED423FD
MPLTARSASMRDAMAVHRLEFPFSVNYVCYASVGACFAVGDAGQLLDLPVLGAIAANLMLIVAALALNTAADVRNDEQHGERGHLVGATRRFGRDRVVRWAAAEAAGGMLLAGLVAVWVASAAILVTAAGIVVLQVLYNVEPVRLKRRGLIGAAVYCVSLSVLPFLLSYWTIRSQLDASTWTIVAGLWVLAVGRATLWSVPDRVADIRTGLRTPAVRHGFAGAVAVSVAAVIVGLAVTGWGLWWRFGPAWALPLVVLQGAFLYGTVAPTSRRIQRRAMPPVAVGMVALTVTPLVA